VVPENAKIFLRSNTINQNHAGCKTIFMTSNRRLRYSRFHIGLVIAMAFHFIVFEVQAEDVFDNPLIQQSGRYYDREGHYQGHMDEDKKRYNKQGKYSGRVDEDGRTYDQNGKYAGRIDDKNKRYSQEGKYLGRQDANGRFYDAQGAYQGRIEKGRLYDKQGRYQGGIEPN
jgi:hypothetical protein